MGLSASQTRFLSLTARQNNVEFQGQQVNQARTELANQSSGLFAEMMMLSVPVAPSQYEFIINPVQQPKIQTILDPQNQEEQDQVELYYASHKPDFTYFNIPMETHYGFDSSGQAFSVEIPAKAQQKTRNVLDKEGNKIPVYEKDADGNNVLDGDGNPVQKKDTAGNLVYETEQYYDLTTGYDPEKYTYNTKTGMFEVNAPDSQQVPYELPESLQAYNTCMSYYTQYSGKDGLLSSKAFNTSTAVNGTINVAKYDSNGKLIAGNAENPNPKTSAAEDKISGWSQTKTEDASGGYTVTTYSPASDEVYELTGTGNSQLAQYAAAMRQYGRDKEQYDEAIARINAETEKIQQNDKQLELQLKQLDTEQQAIQTEMDAIKKVIDKNIDQTFKTFA